MFSKATAPGQSPWDDFLEIPVPKPPRPAKKESKPNTLDQLVAELEKARVKYENQREENFRGARKALDDPEFVDVADRLDKFTGANQKGFVDAIYDLLLIMLKDADLSGTAQATALKAIEDWREGALRLESRFFESQEASYMIGAYNEALVKYGKEAARHLPAMVLPERELARVFEEEFTKRYGPRNAVLNANLLPDSLKEANKLDVVEGKVPPYFGAALAAVPLRLQQMLHPGGLQCGLFLPSGLRAANLNETEKLYVKADYMASAAVRQTVSGVKNLAEEALHKYGIWPRRSGSSLRTMTSSAKLWSGNDVNGGDDEDDDDLFFDVVEADEEDEEFFFDTESDDATLKPFVSEAEAVTALNLLAAIQKQKLKHGGIRTLASDFFTGYLLRDDTDIAEVLSVPNQYGNAEENAAIRLRHIKSQKKAAEKHIDNLVGQSTYVSANPGEQADYVRGVMRRALELTCAGFDFDGLPGIRQEDQDKIGPEIAQYLTTNALARSTMIMEAIKSALGVDISETGDGSPGSIGSSSKIRSGVRTEPRRRGSRPPKPEEKVEQTDESKNPKTTWAEWISGYRGSEFNSPGSMIANVIGFLGPTFVVAGLLGVFDRGTSIPVSVTVQGMSVASSLSVAGKATDTLLQRHIEWARNMTRLRSDISTLWDSTKKRFVELKIDKDRRAEQLKTRITSMIGRLAGYMNLSSSMVADDLSRYIVAQKLRGSGFNFDTFMNYVNDRVGAESNVIPVNVAETVSSVDLSRQSCEIASAALEPLDQAVFNIYSEAGNIIDIDESGEQFLDRVMTDGDALAIKNMFQGCGNTEKIRSRFDEAIESRLTAVAEKKLLDNMVGLYKLSYAQQDTFQEAKSLAGEVTQALPKGANAQKLPTPQTLFADLEVATDTAESVSNQIVVIRADLALLREEQQLVLEELESIEDTTRDVQQLTSLQDKFREVSVQLDKNIEDLARLYRDRQLSFFRELQYVRGAAGNRLTKELYKNMYDDGGLTGVLSDGQSSLSVFDQDKDLHLLWTANNTGANNIYDAIHNGAQVHNARAPASGSDKLQLNQLMQDVFDVFSGPEGGTVQLEKEQLVAKSIAAIDAQKMDPNVADNAKILASTIPEVYQLPILKRDLPGGKAIYMPRLRDPSTLSDDDIAAFSINGTRLTLVLQDMQQPNSQVESQSVIYEQNADEQSSLLKLSQQLGYWKMLFSSASQMVISMGVLASGYITHAASFLLSVAGRWLPERWSRQLTKDLQNVEEIERRIKNDYAKRIGLMRGLNQRALYSKGSYIERLSRATAALRDSSWSQLFTELFIDIPENAERIGEPTDEKDSTAKFANNWNEIAVGAGTLLLGVSAVWYYADEIASSYVFQVGQFLTTFGQQQLLGLMTNHPTVSFFVGAAPLVALFGAGPLDALNSLSNSGNPAVDFAVKTMTALWQKFLLTANPAMLKRLSYGGLKFLLDRLTNLDTLFLSATFVMHYSQSQADAFYFGAQMVFKMSMSYLVPWAVALAVDGVAWTFISRGSLEKLSDQFYAFNLKSLGLDSTKPNATSKELFLLLLETKNPDAFWKLVSDTELLEQFNRTARRNWSDAQIKTYKADGFEIFENYRKKQRDALLPFSWWKALLVGLSNFGVLMVSDNIFDWLQKEAFAPRFLSETFRYGASAMFQRTAGTASEAVANNTRLVAEVVEKFNQTDIGKFTSLSDFADVSTVLKDVVEKLK